MRYAAIATSLLALTSLIACVNADISDPSVCSQQPVSFPLPSLLSQFQTVAVADCAAYPSIAIPAESTTTTLDISQTLSKIDNVASNLNVNITSLTLDNSQGQFDWISGADIYMTGGSGYPMTLLAHYTEEAASGTSLEVAVVMPPDQVLRYLSSGSVTLTITLEASTITACQAEALLQAGALSTNVGLCVSVSGAVSKSL